MGDGKIATKGGFLGRSAFGRCGSSGGSGGSFWLSLGFLFLDLWLGLRFDANGLTGGNEAGFGFLFLRLGFWLRRF